MKLAPIGISTYSRLDHLKQTVEALKQNTLAKKSSLYIFSDAPQKGDEEIVAKVRAYIHTIDGFKEVHIIERETNSRIKNNRGGMTQLLDQYGRCIFMEDDIVTAPGFLAFMNHALDFYQNDENILSITGYCPPIEIPDTYNKDIFILPRFNGWGVGLWKNRYHHVDYIPVDEYNTFIKNKKLVKQFVKNGGSDMLDMLASEVYGRIDAYDVKAMYYQFKTNTYTLYPRKSLVQNIGLDGTGLHCHVTDRFHHDQLWDKVEDFEFINHIQPDKKILKANYRFRSGGFKGEVINFTKQLGLYPLLKKIKDSLK